jgi:hypothetical protein
MSDLQFLFAILVALYGWECACWVRRGGVGFTSWWGRHWRAQHPATMLGNQRGGFIFAPPLPPLSPVCTANQWPCSVGPTGVLFFVATNVNPGWRPAQSGRFLTWTEVEQTQLHGKKLRLKTELIWAAPTTTLARHLFEMLRAIARLAPEARAAAIETKLRETLDGKALSARLAEFQQRTRALRALTNVLFAWLFVVAPLVFTFVGLRLTWIPLAVGLLGLNLAIAILFARQHRHFFPAAGDDRFTQSLIIALAPATTMRARDFLSRALLENFHPLAVAHEFLAPPVFQRLARRWLLDLRQPVRPLCPNSKPDAVAAELFFRTTLLRLTEEWLREQKISPAELGHPPAPADASCRAYCPRCEAQFTTITGTCADCGGIPLTPFHNDSQK